MSSPIDKLCYYSLVLEYLSRAQMYSCNQNTRDAEKIRIIQEKAINVSLTKVAWVLAITPTIFVTELVQILQALLSVVWLWFSCGLLGHSDVFVFPLD